MLGLNDLSGGSFVHEGYQLDDSSWYAFVKVIHLYLKLKGESISCFDGVLDAGCLCWFPQD